MNEQDLRDCFAMFALCGYMTKMGCNPLEIGPICEDGKFAENNADAVAKASYIMADAMLEAKAGKTTVGLPPVRARKTKEK